MTEDARPTAPEATRATTADGHPLSQLFDLSPFPAVVSRLRDHAVLAINQEAGALVGIAQTDAVGRAITDYYVDPAERLALADELRRTGQVDHLRVRIKRAAGDPIWVLASSRVVTWQDEPAVLTVFHDISDQLAAEASLKASERRLAAQSHALTDLTARSADPGERLEDRLRSILHISARALRVARLSMWRFDDERASIRCLGLHRRGTDLRAHGVVRADQYEWGAILRRGEAPRYFEALERERVIAATDAGTDPRTADFEATYLVPNGIGAMLDVPLRHDNAAIGVLCAEHVGGPRPWTVDEQNFAISVANLVAVAMADEERRAALERLAESEARARLIVDTAHDAFIGIGSDGDIVAWNAQAERIFGWTGDEAIGRNLAETIVPHAFRDAHNNGMRRFHATGDAPVVNQRLELTALDRSGREFPVELTITSPMKVEQGYFFGAFLRDISDRRERDAELRRAKEAAEAATRAKSEFLANMSHELRTPLNGVLGYAQLLQRDPSLGATHREALEAIAKCGSQLLDLINDVLDLAKIEAGRLDVEERPTDLARLVTDVKYVVAEAAERKGLRLTASTAAEVPRWVMIDDRHVRQVLLNLLGNAVKFTAEGDVRLTIDTDGAARLRFDVRDTGAGIEPGALTAIFEAFSQTRSGAAAGGTGLGLTISSHLIRRMGGELQVDSVLGQGSRFWFTLPLVAAREAGHADGDGTTLPIDARLAPGEQVTALVVDDSPANRHILAGLLESAGVRVLRAAGGLDGIALAQAHRPDVVFMDLKMTDLDGLEATRRLRQDASTAAIPVIAVTASAFGDIRQTARAAGCVDYLSKPIRVQLLFGMLQTHLGVHFVGGSERAVPRAGQAATGGHRVEIAERLREAVALGDVTAIQGLAERLMAGDTGDAATGERIARLASTFDFEELGRLADSLGT